MDKIKVRPARSGVKVWDANGVEITGITEVADTSYINRIIRDGDLELVTDIQKPAEKQAKKGK